MLKAFLFFLLITLMPALAGHITDSGSLPARSTHEQYTDR